MTTIDENRTTSGAAASERDNPARANFGPDDDGAEIEDVPNTPFPGPENPARTSFGDDDDGAEIEDLPNTPFPGPGRGS